MMEMNNSNECTTNLMYKTKQRTVFDTLFLVIIALLSIFTVSSCESNPISDSESAITAVGELTRASGKEDDGDDFNSAVIFTGNDIQWFNPKTRELKFNKDINCATFQTYQKIHFKLNGNLLFTAQTYASQYQSFVIKDLVLFIDLFTKKCYLHDCYPLDIIINDPDTKKNREKRADAWNSFCSQLKIEGKVK